MTSPSKLRVSIPRSRRIVNPRDPYTPITSAEPTLRGHMLAQPGEVVCITLDDGREALVMRSHLTVEES